MDRLISLEPSNLVPIRIEPGQRCVGELTLRNVMYTMPVAFRVQPMNKIRYTMKPQSGIISPLATLTIEITYVLPPGVSLPDTYPHCEDSFLLHSVVVPGATIKYPSSTFDAVPLDWFTTKKKQVFIDSAISIMFVGSPILAQLVKDGSMDEIREVLEKSNPAWNSADSVDSRGRSLLHIAIAQRRPDIVQLLLEFKPDIELQTRTGSTPLEAAAGSGEALIVELLLARKARTERSETSNWGPIHLAAGNGNIDVLRLLLLKGANVNSLTKDGNTSLHLTVEKRRRDCLRLLLASGASPDIRNTVDGDTPLHIAASLGDEQMVKLLLTKGANKDILSNAAKTAYNLAAEHGHSRLFDALKLGDSLCSASRKGESRKMHKLLESGAAINGRDQYGWTALHRAAFKGFVDTVRALLEKGIDVDAVDEDGYTALHCAAESGHSDVIQLLVKKGADVEARTKKGATALQIAESLNYVGIKTALIHGGAAKDGSMTGLGRNSFKKNSGKEVEKVVVLKRRPSRGRASRGSIDYSPLPLAVL